MDSSSCRFPKPADSQSRGIPEFFKTLISGFPGIPVKIHKIHGFPVRLMDNLLQDFLYCPWECVWIFSGIAHD